MINLAADKHAVFREMAQVLKPGGRLAISDIALKKPIPPEVARRFWPTSAAWRAQFRFEEYKQGLDVPAFPPSKSSKPKADLNVYSKIEGQSVCCPPRADNPGGYFHFRRGDLAAPSPGDFHDRLAELLRKYDVNGFAASVKVFAVKPR